jgi:hypothetical protein
MNTTHPMSSDVVDRGKKIYEEKLRPILEPQHNGKYVVIDVDTGDHELDQDHVAASQRAHKNKPGVVFYVARVGLQGLGPLGARVIRRV